MSDAPSREPDRADEDAPTETDPAQGTDPGPDALAAWPTAGPEQAPMTADATHEASGPQAVPDVPPADPQQLDPAHGAGEAAGTEPGTSPDPRSHQELVAALADAERQRDEYLDDLRRARAEFENFRKRTMREGATQREAGRTDVTEGLLEVLDDLDRTLEAAGQSEDDSLAKGVELVADKLMRALQSSGLQRVDATGVVFDPTEHEAVQQLPADEPRDEPIVAQVLRPGYRLGERVLRAAMVVVEQ